MLAGWLVLLDECQLLIKRAMHLFRWLFDCGAMPFGISIDILNKSLPKAHIIIVMKLLFETRNIINIIYFCLSILCTLYRR